MGMLTLQDDRLRASIDDATGALAALVDLRAGGTRTLREYIAEGTETVPFRLHRGKEQTAAFDTFEYDFTAGTAVKLVWRLEGGGTIVSTVRLEAGRLLFRTMLEWDDGDPNGGGSPGERRSQLENGPDAGPYDALEYPVIGGMGALSDGGDGDYLAHPYATGFVVHNPSKNFTAERPGLRYMPYPEGFSGATMQFVAYYSGGSGLYLATHDESFFPKWLNFYRSGAHLEATVLHGSVDLRPGADIDPPYDVILMPFDGTDWYDAADIYKSWALSAPWCRQGPLSEREASDRPDVLLTETGAATFGINARHDRTRWLNAYRNLVGTKMLHVLGPDWSKIPQLYRNGRKPGGLAEWFPAAFDPSNLEAIRRNGDIFTPFLFDYLILADPPAADHEKGAEALQKLPTEPKSFDRYPFKFMCPMHPYSRELHRERDRLLMREVQPAGVYYDISANNILRSCLSAGHGHAPGAGAELTEAYRENYAESRRAMEAESPEYVLIGTEMVNEVFLDRVDFYQTRAGAQPAAAFEGGPLRDLIVSGEAALAPMFSYVYHEFGPVRLDGWGKLVEEAGSLFFYTVATVYLWGGLFEINQEFSPMEVVDGVENSSQEHYADFAPRGYKLADDRGHYVGKFARLRTGMGNRYLAFGRMLHPPVIHAPKTPYTWFSYNCPAAWKEYDSSGELALPAVVHSAWIYRERDVAIFLANTTDAEQAVTISEPAAWLESAVGDSQDRHTYRYNHPGPEAEPIGPVSKLDTITLRIAPYSVVMLEIVKERGQEI